jgi:hypothetical protein
MLTAMGIWDITTQHLGAKPKTPKTQEASAEVRKQKPTAKQVLSPYTPHRDRETESCER